MFALALAAYTAIVLYGAQTPWRGHVGAVVVLTGTAIIVALFDRYIWDYYYEKRRGVVIPRLLRQFSAGVIILLALLLVLSIGYRAQTQLTGLLAGSGVIAIILGFGMQNLLKTLVAGAGLQIGKPYKLGDWLKIGEHIGQVMEINWADTRLRTNDAVSIEIPNNKIVEDTIINLSSPTPLHAMRLDGGRGLQRPAKSSERRADASRVARRRHRARSATESLPKRLRRLGRPLRDEVLDEQPRDLQRSVRRDPHEHLVRIPAPEDQHPLPRPDAAVGSQDRQRPRDRCGNARAVLRKEPLFACLSDEQIHGLLKDAEVNHFGRGEAVIEEGTDGESMFILLRGMAQVSVTKNDALIRVGVLREGDCFGEMSLLTGEPRSATVRADKDCEVLEIGKPVMGELLRTSPECLNQLSELLAKRKLETEGLVRDAMQPEANAEKQREYTASFMRRLRSFFSL